MLRRAMGLVIGGLLMSAVAVPPGVNAIQADPLCVQDAVAAKQECKARCKDAFLVSKDDCRAVDHACADACRAGRNTCFDGPLAELDACIARANAELKAAKEFCKTQNPLDATALDQCIDAAQVVAFTARDACREELDRLALKSCRKSFRSCIAACQPAPAN